VNANASNAIHAKAYRSRTFPILLNCPLHWLYRQIPRSEARTGGSAWRGSSGHRRAGQLASRRASVDWALLDRALPSANARAFRRPILESLVTRKRTMRGHGRRPDALALNTPILVPNCNTTRRPSGSPETRRSQHGHWPGGCPQHNERSRGTDQGGDRRPDGESGRSACDAEGCGFGLAGN
jgi:hypothetical protein